MKFYSLTLLILSLLPEVVLAGDTENRAVAYCIAKGATEPASFSYCVGGYLTKEEINKCFRGDCFGEGNTLRRHLENARSDLERGPGRNNDLVGCNGWLAKRLGTSCGDAPSSPPGWIDISNNTSRRIIFYLESQGTNRTKQALQAGESARFTGAPGDAWFNIKIYYAKGGGVSYGLDAGTQHEIEDNNQGWPDVYNATPQYHGR